MAADQFLKIDGVEGGSSDKVHPKEMEIEHWNVGASMTPTAGKHATKVVHNINITMKPDRSLPILLQACASGRKFASATITGRKAGGEQAEYVNVKMSEVIIVHCHVGTADGGSEPVADMILNFTKIEWEMKTQDDRGLTGMPVKVGYDVKTDRLA